MTTAHLQILSCLLMATAAALLLFDAARAGREAQRLDAEFQRRRAAAQHTTTAPRRNRP